MEIICMCLLDLVLIHSACFYAKYSTALHENEKINYPSVCKYYYIVFINNIFMICYDPTKQLLCGKKNPTDGGKCFLSDQIQLQCQTEATFASSQWAGTLFPRYFFYKICCSDKTLWPRAPPSCLWLICGNEQQWKSDKSLVSWRAGSIWICSPTALTRRSEEDVFQMALNCLENTSS